MDKEQQERKKRIDAAIEQEKKWHEEEMKRQKREWKVRWATTFISTLILTVLIYFLTGCSLITQKQQDLETVDGLVYTFIVAKVEGNDDLLDQILTDEAKGILEAGRHPYPGAAEIMGDRYEIKRYDDMYKEGGLVYEVTFYRPSTASLSKYNVLVLNGPDGWQIASNSSVDEVIMAEMIAQEDGTLVHGFEGVKAE